MQQNETPIRPFTLINPAGLPRPYAGTFTPIPGHTFFAVAECEGKLKWGACLCPANPDAMLPFMPLDERVCNDNIRAIPKSAIRFAVPQDADCADAEGDFHTGNSDWSWRALDTELREMYVLKADGAVARLPFARLATDGAILCYAPTPDCSATESRLEGAIPLLWRSIDEADWYYDKAAMGVCQAVAKRMYRTPW